MHAEVQNICELSDGDLDAIAGGIDPVKTMAAVVAQQNALNGDMLTKLADAQEIAVKK